MEKINLSKGIVFWPVGNGDSSTIVVDDNTILQIDINHLECADEDDDPHWPVIDELAQILPVRYKKPYLSLFVLTHPDQDHCRGFKRLLKEATIGEIWFTPRVFREFSKDLCDDAKAFQKEAKRRVKEVIRNNGQVDSGDRVRVIGFDDILNEDDYKGFPKTLLTIPGSEVTQLDGEDRADVFRAFIHAPFKDGSDGDRNETSVALQIVLQSDAKYLKFLTFGDLSYPTLSRIFESSDDNDLAWDILLAPHHCSKSAMYWADEGEDEPALKQNIIDAFESSMADDAYIVSSSESIPASNKEGDNPPHALAKARYEEIAETAFLCTHENPNEESPEPIVFCLTDEGLVLKSDVAKAMSTLMEGIRRSRGADTPPKDTVGFGR